jgi:hypothetical protein
MNSFHEVLSTITGTAVLVTVLLIGSLAAKMHRECWVWWYILPPLRVDWWRSQSRVWISPDAARAVIDIASGVLVKLDDLDAGSTIKVLWPDIKVAGEVPARRKKAS